MSQFPQTYELAVRVRKTDPYDGRHVAELVALSAGEVVAVVRQSFVVIDTGDAIAHKALAALFHTGWPRNG